MLLNARSVGKTLRSARPFTEPKWTPETSQKLFECSVLQIDLLVSKSSLNYLLAQQESHRLLPVLEPQVCFNP